MSASVAKLQLKAQLANDKATAKLAEYHSLLGLARGYEESAKEVQGIEAAEKNAKPKKLRRKRAKKKTQRAK